MKEYSENWMALCEQASDEQDADKLMQLAIRITELLNKKQTRLKEVRRPAS